MIEALTLILYLLAAHWVCDYPLQGDFLANAKMNGPLRVYHLIAHSGIHAAAVALITGNIWLGLAEWVAHTIIDQKKVEGYTTFAVDQALHILCKMIWVTILLT